MPRPRRPFKLMRKLWPWALLLTIALVIYSRWIEPVWYEVVTLDLTLPHLAQEFEGYKITQVSDIHADRWMNRDRLSGLVQDINTLESDLIVLTGDYVTGEASDTAYILEVLEDLRSPDGTFAVMGNHDAWTDIQAIEQVLVQAGITMLNNAVVPIQRGSAVLDIAGVDDVWAGRDRLGQVLDQLSRFTDNSTTGNHRPAAILLAHEPDYADTSAATGRFDLELSGHSHGGQVVFGPLRPALPPWGRRYPIGQYQVGEMIQYTNRGIGASPPHVRLGCRPELTVVRLHAPDANANIGSVGEESVKPNKNIPMTNTQTAPAIRKS